MTQNWRALLGPYGIWRPATMVTPVLAADIEGLGYGALWLADGGSDALIDALVAHGDAGEVARQLGEFVTAGADHVCLQLLTGSPGADPVPGYRALADVLDLAG
jgi:hypothetical protein